VGRDLEAREIFFYPSPSWNAVFSMWGSPKPGPGLKSEARCVQWDGHGQDFFRAKVTEIFFGPTRTRPGPKNFQIWPPHRQLVPPGRAPLPSLPSGRPPRRRSWASTTLVHHATRPVGTPPRPPCRWHRTFARPLSGRTAADGHTRSLPLLSVLLSLQQSTAVSQIRVAQGSALASSAGISLIHLGSKSCMLLVLGSIWMW
jgi:hypothetical protein